MTERDPEIIGVFLDEAEGLLAVLNDGLLRIEGNADAGRDSGEINALFRSLHSLKGASGMLGLDQINQLSHGAEALLDQVRAGKRPLDTAVVQALLEAVGGLGGLLQNLKGSAQQVDLASLLSSLDQVMASATPPLAARRSAGDYMNLFSDEASECIAGLEADLLKLDEISKGAPDIERDPLIKDLFRHAHQLKASSAAMGFVSLSALMHAVEAILDRLREETMAPDQGLVTTLLGAVDKAKASVQNAVAGKDAEFDIAPAIERLSPYLGLGQAQKREISHGPAADPDGGEHGSVHRVQTMRVDVERLEQLMNLSGELVVHKARFAQVGRELKDVLNVKALSTKAQLLETSLRALLVGGADAGWAAQLSALVQDAENLSCGMKELERGKLIYQKFQEATHQMDLVTQRIEKAVLDIRMVPVGPLFNRFKRMVRDLSKELGKEIRLELQGEETEIDKKLIDELGDPLTHLVRNAADHGIEAPGVRQAGGKAPEGVLTLDAFQKGNRICLTINDDGKGIDHEILRRKAVEKGVISQQEADRLSPKEAVGLIFHAGFSTAEKVTQISGRGVGMDIVKKRIEELSGTLEIETVPGAGTKFTISLPLTLATQKCLLAEIRGTVFALPLDSVMEIVRTRPKDLHTIQQEGFVRIREKVVPIKRINDLFRNTRFPALHEEQQAGLSTLTLVVVAGERCVMAIEVDRLIGEETIVIKSLSRNYREISGLAGVSILGTGNVALILDTNAILEAAISPAGTMTQ